MSQNDFHPVVLKKDDSFCVFLPEWNISGEGKNLEEAYAQFESQKRAIEERAKKFGLGTISAEPYPTLKRPHILHDLGLFFAKVATASLAVICTVILLLPPILASVRHHFLPRMGDALNHYAVELPTKLNERLDRVTPEQEKKIVEEWGKLLKRTSSLRDRITGGSK